MKKILILFIALLSSGIIYAQNFEWAKSFAATTHATAFSVNKDSHGNVYTFGLFNGTVDLNPDTAAAATMFVTSPAYNGSYFLEKLDSLGTLVWVKHFRISTGSVAWSYSLPEFDMVLDSDDYIYISSKFYDTVDLDPGPLVCSYVSVGSVTGFSRNSPSIAKFDPLGNLVWGKANVGSYGTNFQCTSLSIEVDKNKNVYTLGNFSGTVDFDPGPLTHNITSTPSNAYLQKLDSLGNLDWVITYNGTFAPQKMIMDDSLNMFILGVFSGTVDFDPGAGIYNLTSVGTAYNIILSKVNSSGNLVWAKQMGIGTTTIMGAASDGLVFDTNGDINILGTFNKTMDCDPGPAIYNISIPTSPTSSQGIYKIKLDPAGNFLSALALRSTGAFLEQPSLKIDQQNNSYIAGLFSGSLDSDPGTGVYNLVASVSSSDIFLIKLNPAGNLVWAKSMGNTSDEGITNIEVDEMNNIYATGYFRSTLDFDPSIDTFELFSTTSFRDYFVFKWSQDTCSDLFIVPEYVNNITCLGFGEAKVHAISGLAPYSYFWNSSPPDTDSILNTVNSSGIYKVTVTDFVGCTNSTSYLINGPYFSGIDLKPYSTASVVRPGSYNPMKVRALNLGCTPTDGKLSFILDPLANFISSSIPPDNISGDTLSWNFFGITYDTPFKPNINIYVPLSLGIGDSLCFTAITTSFSGEFDTTNNVISYCLPVVAAYDPNIKSVYPLGECSPHYIEPNQKLTYTVEFQNTGTAAAIDVYVLDSLDSHLDLNTARVIESSHSMVTEVLPGNVLKFRFDNIMLPDSTSDEPGSHGYVIFELDPLSALPNGTAIENSVGIYFDFNPPIYTNTVFNTISDGTLNVGTTLSGALISAVLSGASYQWINCATGDPILGETSQTYNITANGSYAVIVSDGCMTDTSACILITTTGINGVSTRPFSIYPNPAQNNFIVNTSEETELSILNVIGEIVFKTKVKDKSIIDISNLTNGIYFISNTEGKVVKFIKQ